MTSQINVPLLEVYEQRVRPRLAEQGECLVFTGSRSVDGYGSLWLSGRSQRVHRIVWAAHNGAIPAGMFVCHRCDNPPCCRIEHLFVGTVSDNNRDRESKGRSAPNLELGRAALHAKARAVTHCPKGHAYAGRNLTYTRAGTRSCRECRRLKAELRRRKAGVPARNFKRLRAAS